jgi:hypothetical protein
MHRCVFGQRSVGSRFVIVARVAAQYAPEVRLVKDNDVVQAFAANGPDQSFGKAILPRRTRCNRFVPDAHCTHPLACTRGLCSGACCVAACATSISCAGHASVAHATKPKLTSYPDHSVGADQHRNSPRSIHLIMLSRSCIEHSSPDSDLHAKRTEFTTATGTCGRTCCPAICLAACW